MELGIGICMRWTRSVTHREVELALKRIMEKESVDERLKAENPMEWVRRVNGIKANVEREVERRLYK